MKKNLFFLTATLLLLLAGCAKTADIGITAETPLSQEAPDPIEFPTRTLAFQDMGDRKSVV